MSKILILSGVFLIVLGIGLNIVGKIPLNWKLPGDIIIKRENFEFYFPITTGLLLSFLLSVFFYLWKK